MLLHALSDSSKDTLFNQFCYEIESSLDVNAFKQAWQNVVSRHTALRSAFVWENVNQPLQVVRNSVNVEFSELDWRELNHQDIGKQFSAYLQRDRQNGFDLQRAPLLRFCLMRLADSRWRFVWSSHHLIIDRWCLAQIFSEVDSDYVHAFAEKPDNTRPSCSKFRTYIDWVMQQDRTKAYSYWASTLRGFKQRSRITSSRSAETGEPRDASYTAELCLPRSSLTELKRFARVSGVTLNTVVQGAWSLAMNRILKKQDIVFGATVSGRPSEIPNVESIIGSFINNVPVRIQIPAERKVTEWLMGIQASQFDRLPFEYVAIGDIQRCADLNDSEPIFDSLLVWLSGIDHVSRLPMRQLSSKYATAYPLTLSILEKGDELMLRADARLQCLVSPKDLLDELASSLRSLLAVQSDTSLGELPGFRFEAGYHELTSQGISSPTVSKIRRPSDTVVADVAGGRERLGKDVLTELLRSEWKQVLGVTELADDADFFELGGTSIQAASLHVRIENATGQSIPMLHIFGNPTVYSMVGKLFAQDWPIRADMATGLRTTGEGTPLFCVASPEVNTVGYALLTRHLQPNQDVYALQSAPDSRQLRQVNPAMLPDLAEKYILGMRDIQPAGPYRLLGMCTGSHIAVEMARQLESVGEKIEFIGIINTWAMYTISPLYYLNRFLNILRYYIRRLSELLRTYVSPNTSRHDSATDQQSVSRQSDVITAESIEGHGSAWIQDVGFESRDPHRPKIESLVSVFSLRHQVYWRVKAYGLGWSKHAKHVEDIQIPGDDHDFMLREPYIHDLGLALSASLAESNRPRSVRCARCQQ